MLELCCALLDNIKELSTDEYGNFVVQAMLEHGTPLLKHQVAQVLLDTQLLELAMNPFSSNVNPCPLMEIRFRVLGFVF